MADPGTEDIFRLHVLGVGNYSSENFQTVSFVLQAGSRLVLIEAPIQPHLRLADYRRKVTPGYFGGASEVSGIEGLVLDNINDLVVTHDDLDHSAGLESIGILKYHLGSPSIKSGAPRIKLYTTPDVYTELRRSFDYRLRNNACSFDACFESVVVRAGDRTNIGDVQMFLCGADHGKPGFGMLFDCKGRTFSYSGDTRLDKGLLDFMSVADVMVHECNGSNEVHTSPAQLKWWLERSGYNGRLYTCHFSDESIPRSAGLEPLSENTFIDI